MACCLLSPHVIRDESATGVSLKGFPIVTDSVRFHFLLALLLSHSLLSYTHFKSMYLVCVYK